MGRGRDEGGGGDNGEGGGEVTRIIGPKCSAYSLNESDWQREATSRRSVLASD